MNKRVRIHTRTSTTKSFSPQRVVLPILIPSAVLAVENLKLQGPFKGFPDYVYSNECIAKTMTISIVSFSICHPEVLYFMPVVR